MIEFKRLNPDEVIEHEELLRTVVDLMIAHGVRGNGLDINMNFITDMVSLVVGICPHCYAAGKDCQCWNDE